MKTLKWGLLLIVLGVVIGAITFVSGDTTSSFILSDDDFTAVELDYDGERFTSFDFDLENKRVNIVPSDDDDIHIAYYDSTVSWINVTDTDETLRLDNDHEWYAGFTFSLFVRYQTYYTMTVELPEQAYEDITIHSSNGSFTVENRDFAAELDLSTSNGSFYVDHVNADDRVTFVTSNGDVNIDTFTTQSSLSAETSNGEIDLADVSAADIMVTTSNGKISLHDITCTELTGLSSNGRVTATEITADVIDLMTSNGDVNLDLIGSKQEYDYHVETTNGECTVDGVESGNLNADFGNAKSIHLRSTNGDINLDFNE